MDREQIGRTLARMTHEIAEQAPGTERVGSRRHPATGRGPGRRLAQLIEAFYGVRPPTGTLDITFYRDDLDTRSDGPGPSGQPVVHSTTIPFDVNGMTILLVDDVLYTGRSIRAAIDTLFDYGRPAAVRLAVLVDRGHRDLPIRPDFVGKNVPTSRSEKVVVHLLETDGEEGVVLEE